MLDFCIIGSGISGSTIANLLNKKYSVAVYDKARGYGGRSSFKKYKDKVGFDHGLQYISPKSKKFKTFTNQLIKKKVLKKWGGNHLFLHKTVKEIKNMLNNEILTNWNPTKIHHRMIALKKDQLMQQEWAKNTDPDDRLRWNLDPLNDSSMLDQTDI